MSHRPRSGRGRRYTHNRGAFVQASGRHTSRWAPTPLGPIEETPLDSMPSEFFVTPRTVHDVINEVDYKERKELQKKGFFALKLDPEFLKKSPIDPELIPKPYMPEDDINERKETYVADPNKKSK